MKFLLAAISSLVLATAALAGGAYPNRAVTANVGYAAGGTADIVMRELAQIMEPAFPAGLVINNRAGAGGTISLAATIRGSTEGYEFAILPNSNIALAPQINKLAYKNPDDMQAVINLVGFAPVLVVRADSPFKTLADLVAAAKAKPDSVTIGLPGLATVSDFNIIMLQQVTGAKVVRVPFAGWGQTGSQLLGNHISAAVAQPAEVVSQLEGGTLRVLASFSDERQPGLPSVPTAKEQGFPVAYGARYEIAVPKGTAPEAIKYLHDNFAKALETPRFKKFLAERAMAALYMDGAATQKANWDDYRQYEAILKTAPVTR